MYKKIIVIVLVTVGMSLCLTGCVGYINIGNTGLSDFSYADAESYAVGEAELSETVEHIEIVWLAGNVTVIPHNADTVSISEKSPTALTEDAQVHYRLDGTKLYIQFCGSGKWRLDEMEKDLTVRVPADLRFVSLTVKSLSADIHLDAIQAESVHLDTGSGNAALTDCDVTDLVQADTTSGWLDVRLSQPLKTFRWSTASGTLQVNAPMVQSFSANSVSGAVGLSVEKEPKALDIQTTSGKIDLALPEDASFTLDYDSTSGELSSDLTHRTENGKSIFGDGNGEYVIGTVSGNVRITAAGSQ